MSEIKVIIIPEKKRRCFKAVPKIYAKRKSIYSGKIIKKIIFLGKVYFRKLKEDNELAM